MPCDKCANYVEVIDFIDGLGHLRRICKKGKPKEMTFEESQHGCSGFCRYKMRNGELVKSKTFDE